MFKNTKKLAIAMFVATIVSPIVAGCKNGRCNIRRQPQAVVQPTQTFVLNQVNVIDKQTGAIVNFADVLGVARVEGAVQFNPNNNTWTLVTLVPYSYSCCETVISLEELNTNLAALNAIFTFQNK